MNGAERPQAVFAGFRFDTIATEAVIAEIDARAADAPFGYIVTPNVDHVVRLHEDKGADAPAIRQAYRSALLTLCDSRVLARLALMSRIRLPVTAGSDLTAKLFAGANADAIAVIGGSAPQVDALHARYPGNHIVHHEPPMGLRHNADAMAGAVAFVVAARARLVFLALGSPQQELLALRITEDGRAVGTGLCIGASIDFLTGKARRAPLLMQRAGLEWLHRLVTDPGRLWKRYLVSGPRVLLYAFRAPSLSDW